MIYVKENNNNITDIYNEYKDNLTSLKLWTDFNVEANTDEYCFSIVHKKLRKNL